MAVNESWRPSVTPERLRRRADYHALIRARFARQGVIEVDTPVLSQFSCLDPEVPSMKLGGAHAGRWLQTSPENHMKRMLASGSGPIYRLGPVFREGEQGRWHAPEFTMLEWYRPGFDDVALMQDVAELVAELGGPKAWVARRYYDLIRDHVGWTPADDQEVLAVWCEEHGLVNATQCSRDGLLDFAMGVVIGPQLGDEELVYVTHFPASQAALAKLDPEDVTVARRFELYWKGIELANGFLELCDAEEQQARFAVEKSQRAKRAMPQIPVDDHLLAALRAGLPEASGVALGIDRLYALLMGAQGVAEVQPFSWEIA